jgi:hypothetical protein
LQNESFTIRKFKGVNKPALENKNAQEKKSETMSWAGGNAAGTAAVNLASHLFTRDENKPATKKDIKEIKQLFITQHHHIKNMPDRYDGARPFTICKRKILFI